MLVNVLFAKPSRKHYVIYSILNSLCLFTLSLTATAANEVYNQPAFSGPGAHSTASILKNVKQARQGEDGQAVIIRGRLTGHLPPDHYWFQDSTGKMVVEIDDDAWKFISKPVSAQTSVQLIGEIDRETTSVTVEVKAVLP